MPLSYECCDETDQKVAVIGFAMMQKYHGDLFKAGLEVSYIFARADRNEAGEIMANPVMVGGFPRDAKVKIIGLKERADGRADVEILIDADRWEKLSDPEKDAVLDQMFQHLELKKDPDTTEVLTDDLGRPKLKMLKPDHCHQWWDEVAKRHGAASPEVKEARAFADAHGQVYFGWAKPASDSAEAQVFPAGTTVTLTTGEKTVTVTGEQFQEMTKPKRGRGRPKKAAAASTSALVNQ